MDFGCSPSLNCLRTHGGEPWLELLFRGNAAKITWWTSFVGEYLLVLEATSRVSAVLLHLCCSDPHVKKNIKTTKRGSTDLTHQMSVYFWWFFLGATFCVYQVCFCCINLRLCLCQHNTWCCQKSYIFCCQLLPPRESDLFELQFPFPFKPIFGECQKDSTTANLACHGHGLGLNKKIRLVEPWSFWSTTSTSRFFKSPASISPAAIISSRCRLLPTPNASLVCVRPFRNFDFEWKRRREKRMPLVPDIPDMFFDPLPLKFRLSLRGIDAGTSGQGGHIASTDVYIEMYADTYIHYITLHYNH